MAESRTRVLHPCQKCGACCGYFRVEFPREEIEPGILPNPVPRELAERAGENKLCLIGTNTNQKPKCVALGGRIGDRVHCLIYENRPSPCREFEASFSNGRHNPRCDEARKRYGLKPLRPKDYEPPEKPCDRNPSLTPNRESDRST